MKRVGFSFEDFIVKMKNAIDAGMDMYLVDVSGACRCLENWKPMYIPQPRVDYSDKALNFYQGGETEEKYE